MQETREDMVWQAGVAPLLSLLRNKQQWLTWGEGHSRV